MATERCEVAVVGAGPVGLAAALAFASAGFDVALVGPEPERRDGRTAALLQPSIALMNELGAWEALRPAAGALRTLRIVDDTGSLFRPPPVEFRADEIGLDAFGWNVENAALSAKLARRTRETPGLRWRETLLDRFEPGPAPRLALADGAILESSLVVGADGRGSRVRAGAGIPVRERAYGQTAFTTVLGHERDHGDVSTEFHTRTGPFTLVPLPGRRSSLVWVTLPRHAARLQSASPSELARAVESASHGVLGAVTADGPRGVVPLHFLSATRLTGPGVALIGEAAHVLPPIGAQGLNLGFADVAALTAAATVFGSAGADAWTAVLTRFERERRLDLRLRGAAVDGLNRALLSSALPLDALRGLSLGLLGRLGPLRRAVMRAGLNPRTSAGAA